MDFHEACAAILADRANRALNYAVNYAQYGLSVTDPREQRVQALYILNNISKWRGDVATQARIALKRAAGMKLTKKELENEEVRSF